MILKNKIEKKEFVEIMNSLKEIREAEDKATEALQVLGIEGYFSIYKATSIIEKILAIEFDDDEDNDYIGYFIYELEFGKNYYDGIITESDGTPIPMSTSEELYDFLVYNMYEKEAKFIKEKIFSMRGDVY